MLYMDASHSIAGLQHVQCVKQHCMCIVLRCSICKCIQHYILIPHAETTFIVSYLSLKSVTDSYIYTITHTSSLLNHLLASSSITALQSSTVLTNSGTSLKPLSTATGGSLQLLPTATREADTVTQPSTHTEHTYEELADVVAPTISTADRRTDSERTPLSTESAADREYTYVEQCGSSIPTKRCAAYTVEQPESDSV